MTAWLDDNLTDARELLAAERYREALQALLIVLSVYPDSPEALELAAGVVYFGTLRDRHGELTTRVLGDPRLDPVFCACESAGCSAGWVSFGQTKSFDKNVKIANARGVRCTKCGGYFCRAHYARVDGGNPYRCPECGRRADPAPRRANGRSSVQTSRLNHPLVHVYVVREGPQRFGPEFVDGLLKAVSPEVFDEDESPRITGWWEHPWPEDPHMMTMARICQSNEEYLGDQYSVYFFPGTESSSEKRWLIVKIYAKRLKYIDPDAR
ncbi:hypothetical protein AB0L06_34695 [Spirillospora sp. NPDC052269]